jgi:hypothetical protein
VRTVDAEQIKVKDVLVMQCRKYTVARQVATTFMQHRHRVCASSADQLYRLGLNIVFGEPGSPVSIVSGYTLNNRAIEVRSLAEAKGFFPLASLSRPSLGPTQPPVQCEPGGLSLGLKRGRA